MFSASNSQSLFLSTFYEIEKYSQDSIFNIQRDIDEKNMSLIPIIQSNPSNSSPEIKQKIYEITCLQRRIEAFKIILNHVKQLLNSSNDIASLPNRLSNSFETILWLLWKSDLSFWFQQTRNTLETTYGKNTLIYFELFNNTNVKALEEIFKFDFREEQVKEHITQIQNMYCLNQNTQLNGVQYPDNNNMLCFKQDFSQNIQNLDPNISRQPLQTISSQIGNINNPISDQKNQKTQNISKPQYYYEEEKICNKSHIMNFNKDNGLQISEIKGVKTENIEFYDQIQPALKTKGELFEDQQFPPIPTSVAKDIQKRPIATQVIWKRIPEVYNTKQITICSDEMGPNDIHQGRIGNCFFLSALSTLAEQRHYIQRLFHSRGISSTGCYSIWLCDSGEWKNIILDDYIPCTPTKEGGFIPRFSRSKGNDMWVLLLEKAYAKLYGSYFGTQSGYQGEALAALTGAPIKYFKSQKDNGISHIDQVWLFFTGNLENKFVCTACSRKESETVNNKEMGVVSVHSYAVLDAKEVTLSDGRKERIIKMRNPWGNREWRGEWGDNSVYWTPELKKQLNYQPQLADGVFWISLEDFHKHFYQPCVCKVHWNFGYSFIKLGENKKQSVFVAKMTVKDSGFAYVTVQQKRRKHFRGVPEYGYSFVRVFLAKLDGNGQISSVIHAKYKNKQSIVIGENFQIGDYLVFVDVAWAQNIYNELILSAYSSVPIEFQEEPLSKYHIPTLYSDLLKVYLYNSNDPKMKTKQLKHIGKQRDAWKYSLVYKFGLGTIMFKNQEKDCDLHYKYKINSLNNMTIASPETSDLNSVILIVPPGEERLLIFKAVMPFLHGKSYGYTTTETLAFPPSYTKEQLKQLCREKGKKYHSFKKGQIEIFTFSHKSGLATYYINHSPNAIIRDEVVFNMPALVNGEERIGIEIIVEAGQDYLLDIRIKNIFAEEKLTQTLNPKIVE